MESKSKYLKYTTENFINLIVEENLKKKDLVKRIENDIAEQDLLKRVLQKVDFAYKRMNEPLENDIKLLLIIFPFGVVNKFSQNSIFDLGRNKSLGFTKKIKEYQKYSFIGLILYLLIILSIIFFF
jgi:hypothetical protein